MNRLAATRSGAQFRKPPCWLPEICTLRQWMGIDRRMWIVGALGLALALAGPLPPIDGRPLDPEAVALASIHRDQANHFAFLGVDRWQLTGYRGQGIKIAILDTGF